MTSRPVDPRHDPAHPQQVPSVTITFDGDRFDGIQGQSVAGILLANGQREWRTTSIQGRPRGVFCGIGVCFDCLVTVDDLRDVRACLFRPLGGEVVARQCDLLPHNDERG